MQRQAQSKRRKMLGISLAAALFCLGCDEANEPISQEGAFTPAEQVAQPSDLTPPPIADIPGDTPQAESNVSPDTGPAPPAMLDELANVPQAPTTTPTYAEFPPEQNVPRLEPTPAPPQPSTGYPLPSRRDDIPANRPRAKLSDSPRVFAESEFPESSATKAPFDALPPEQAGSPARLTPEQLSAFSPREDRSAAGVSAQESRTLGGATDPSNELAAAARRAQEAIQRATRLVERGAVYSARIELLNALKTLADAQDTRRLTDGYSRALLSGLTALDEAQDFVADSPEVVVDVAERAAGHRTLALAGRDLRQLGAVEALECYMAHAHTQLTIAGGDLLPAADAFFALGKLHMLTAPTNVGQARLETLRATTLFQVAMVVEPRHAMAANELGVLFARVGRLEDARSALQHSASLAAHPATWRNLSAVHRRLNEAKLADLADRESTLAAARWNRIAQETGRLADGMVQVVDPQTLARSSPVNTYDRGTTTPTEPRVAERPPTTPPSDSIGPQPRNPNTR